MKSVIKCIYKQTSFDLYKYKQVISQAQLHTPLVLN